MSVPPSATKHAPPGRATVWHPLTRVKSLCTQHGSVRVQFPFAPGETPHQAKSRAADALAYFLVELGKELDEHQKTSE